MAEEVKTLEQVQSAQADPNDTPKPEPAPSKDPVTGKFLKADGQDGKSEGGDHFKNLRKEVREAQKALKERDEKVRVLETRFETLMDVMERRSAAKPSETDDLSHLSADDPDRPLIDRKVRPLLKGVASREELDTLKAEIARLKGESDEAKGAKEKFSVFQRELRDYTADNGLTPEVSTAISEVIAAGKVSGTDYEDAFDNALIYLKGAGKMPSAKAKGKEPGDERTSVGGVMPGQAGAPVSSDDYRVLRKSYNEAKAEGDGEAENRAFQNLIAKIRDEQAR